MMHLPRTFSTRLLLSIFLIFTPALHSSDTPAKATFRNALFEEGITGWQVTTYGAQAEVTVDPAITHEGKKSVRISSTMESDTALGQEMTLDPAKMYQITGWVRTNNLDPHAASVSATIQVQKSEGKGSIVSGVNRRGTTEWTRVALAFGPPPDGKIRLVLFFVGFGKGTGTVWFSDLKLEEIDPRKFPLKITHQPLFKESIDPFQYGQFVEYLCDLIPSMWAEKIHDGSFEGLTPYKVRFLGAKDSLEQPWYPSGATNRANFTLDKTNPVSGLVSQKIAVTGSSPCTVGVSQDGLALDANEPCLLTCYLRQMGISGPVHIRLKGTSEELAACEFTAGQKWQKFSARLTPRQKETSGRIEISFRGPGTLWIDNVSLMPVKTVGGWRSDVVEAVKELRPGIIRFGGSALDDANLGEFDWRDTLGNPDHRKPFRAWGGLQPTGPGLEEIVQFCRSVNAEPLICVRVTKKGVQDAADQVEYFNGDGNTPMGRLRASNGHPEPYRIMYWQIGNERSGSDYENRLPEFCKAMKAVDPSICLLSSYPSAGVLEKAGKWLDFVCPHQYSIGDIASTEAELLRVRELIQKHARKRSIKVGVTEWNTTAGDFGPRRGMLWTLENALLCSRYQNLLHRNADLVTIANRSNLINSFCSGIIQTDSYRIYKTPTYYAQKLYATYAGEIALKIESNLPVNLVPDLSATLSKDGTTLTLFAVNNSLQEEIRPLDLSAFGDSLPPADVFTLSDTRKAGEPDVTNDFDSPNRVAVTESHWKATSSRFDYTFPPLSLTVLRWKVK
ncbi:carbohydrate binding domain-containing protein [Telmatocola sphagniphila]|uniref:non-reducing end alpha-L-arabinofuranosidase n=1 Tax=Telmatocola sphagniphila TaxID=1123043 RepID=A0A8E6B991_9BACT|nr:alpha-L-arabinofuranosidase C-terminal domain-containing protein [Telmatocola sphagniphila]QVL34096.1 carbohydrate binding domain-containing protein [Telmatocola sphagniphila]